MGMVFILGLMDDDTKDNTKMIRNMEQALILGQMGESTKGSGRMIKDMGKDSIL